MGNQAIEDTALKKAGTWSWGIERLRYGYATGLSRTNQIPSQVDCVNLMGRVRMSSPPDLKVGEETKKDFDGSGSKMTFSRGVPPPKAILRMGPSNWSPL